MSCNIPSPPVLIGTSEEIVRSSLSSKKLIRDAYILLHGIPCTLSYNSLGTSRVDFFGDLETEGVNYLTKVDIKLVVNLAALIRLIDSFDIGTDESNYAPLKSSCQLDQVINRGDRINFPNSVYPGRIENKIFQVSDVKIQHHIDPYSKEVTLVILRDE
jgi:hypothetical protein